MPDMFSKPDFEKARRLGRSSGSDLKKQVGDCPYRHDALPLRDEWIAGFSEGRITLEKARSAGAPSA